MHTAATSDFRTENADVYGYGRRQYQELSKENDAMTMELEIDRMRQQEFPQMQGHVYLDHAGATMYAKSQLEKAFAELQAGLFGNPHSQQQGRESTSAKIDAVRRQVLRFFSASEDEYTVIFTSGATAGLKLVGECFPWSDKSMFAHAIDSHTSVLGIRGYATKHGAATECVQLSELQQLESHHVATATRGFLETDNCRSYSLFAYSAECNFSGVQHPLSIVDAIRNGHFKAGVQTSPRYNTDWLVLVDAAKYVATHRLDLSVHQPDFVVLSFYKMFGYPTGLGALLVKRSTLPLMKKDYYGGGTVESIFATKSFVVPRRGDDGAMFTDGTQSFLSILSLHHGLNLLERLTMERVEQHTASLTKLLYTKLTSLKHWNGLPICKVYGNHHIEQEQAKRMQGPIVACNFLRSDGSFVGYSEVKKLAEIQNIHIRTGCFCNPGACQHYLQLQESDLLANINAGHVCGDEVDLVNGTPTGAVRVSIGYMSTVEDILAFIDFVVKYFVSRVAPQVQTKELTSMSGEDTKSIFLRKISLFPIKSCAGMTVPAWPVGSRGLLFDREWAIVDNATGKVLSQKEMPELCFIHSVVDLTRQTLTIIFKIPNSDTNAPDKRFVLPLQADISQRKFHDDQARSLRVCTDTCKGRDVGEEVSQWLSSCLKRSCRLVRVSSQHLRDSQASTLKKRTMRESCTLGQDPLVNDAVPAGRTAKIGFANQGQYLLLSRQSIAHFNSVLTSVDPDIPSVSEDAFRANLIVDGCAAFAEDQWKRLQIGREAVFDVSGPCSRCSMVNIDQQTGEFNRRPLQVLSSYRRKRSSIFFGQFLTRIDSIDQADAVKWLHVEDPLMVEVSSSFEI